MKKYIFLFVLIFSMFLIFTACPFGLWHEDEYSELENTEASLNPEKESYDIDELMEISIKSLADFSEYGKYEFRIKVLELDEQTNSYKESKNCVFIEDGVENRKDEIKFEYEKNDELIRELTKNISIKFSKEGNFACYVYVDAYFFYESGGFGSNGYRKGWKINVVNHPSDLQNVVRIGHSAQLTSIL